MQLPLSASALALLGVGAVLAGVLILIVLAVRRRTPAGAAPTPADQAALWGAGATPSAAPQPAAPPVPSTATPTAGVPRAGDGNVGAARVSAEPVRGAPDPNAAAGSLPEPVSGSAGRAATARPAEVSARVESPVGGPDRAEPAPAHATASPRRRQTGSSRTVAAAVAEAFAQRAADRAAASASRSYEPGSAPAGAPSTYAPPETRAADDGDAGSPESAVPAQAQPLAAPEASDPQAQPSPVRRSGGAADNDAPALGLDGDASPAATVGSDAGGWVGASDRRQPEDVAQIAEPATNGGRHPDAPEPISEGLGQTGVSGLPPDEGGLAPALLPDSADERWAGRSGVPEPRSEGVGKIPQPRVGSGDGQAGVPEPRSDRGEQALAWAPTSDVDGRAAVPGPGSGDDPAIPAAPGSNGGGPVDSAGAVPDGDRQTYAAEQVTGGAPLGPEPEPAGDMLAGVRSADAAGSGVWTAEWSAVPQPAGSEAAPDPVPAAVPNPRSGHDDAARPDIVAGNDAARQVRSSAPDVRDRLLAVLLDDPERAVGATVELEACLRELGRLSDAVRKERAVLPDVLHRLTAAGLRPEQLARLAAMPVAEVERLLEAAPAERAPHDPTNGTFVGA
jgi:hypothetical protein